jgi:hypothetical protein
MLRRLAIGSCLAAVLVAWGPVFPAGADGFEVSRPKVTRSTRIRTAPTLPSEEEPQELEEMSVPANSDWEDYYREKADYYREKRQKERAHRAGSCMFGADGSVIYAPPGRDC